ncbi:C6 transcription factor, putative [Talaromyces stipitatus ATCC 10500]|uniref:C6 transcription factor, putative n=1 Tax=Talaromyces stipitatus (strain ATCC 10500 / CBS 375.48 / QM 6759 / NRRL 1006) TaxID=441959 RepID=B8M123_TALSN|nr:C6 transcription factor, putative [Talaromyces stipitatus ATCC 10500]EED21803.1 C6 transcription factor, putative [Talaromyces stipitatus ATCC 10500]
MSPKRKFSDVDSSAMYSTGVISADDAPSHKSRSFGRNVDRRNSSWRVMGDNAVPSSLPLSNLTDAVRELIDPDFHPELEQFLFDDESPQFLKPVSPRIATEDVEYLRSKGALTIPEPSLRNELLKAYVQWVYSSLPVLDLHSFLASVAQNKPDANISLLLFQAIMFAGTAFVDIRHLQAAGFKTRREARKAFFNNTRLLYVFDYEDDRIAIIQSILLMTYYYEKEETFQKDIWHWIGVCYTQAQSIGLHRDPSKSSINEHTKRLRIRLWWCLYSRDRQIALALRRPTQINEGICNVPLITLTDFDIRPYGDAVDQILPECRHMSDTYLQRRLAIMFIETVKLCQCLGRALFAQYTPSNFVSDVTQETTITLVPRQASDAELQRCGQKLDAWLGNLPEEATCVTPRERKDLKPGDDVLFLHASMLQMIYHATCTVLYRPRASSSNITTTLTTSKTSISAAQKIIRDAALHIADTVQHLRTLGLTPYLPTYGLTVMIPAAVAHLTDLKSANPVVRDGSKWNFRLCIEIISGLRDIYPAADYETECLEKAFQLQHGQRMLKSVYVMQDATVHSPRGAPTFVNTTELDLSILRPPREPSQIIESPAWTFDWQQDQDMFHRDGSDKDNDCWTINLDNDLDIGHFGLLSDGLFNNTGDGVPPHILMIQGDNDDIELSQNPDLPLTISREGEETTITGDLERDLGFI